MKNHERGTLHAVLLAAFTFLSYGCATEKLPMQVDKYCVSDSGLSRYLIKLNVPKQTGNISYQYMGQDVRYIIRSLEVDGSQLTGHADFQSSSTGEIRGAPILFSYESDRELLKDGQVTAKCVDWHENEPQ